MLSRRTSVNNGRRNEIVDATDQGLVLRIDGRHEMAPWLIVKGVSAGRAKLGLGEHWVLLLAFETKLRGEERLFIVGELEPAWVPVTALLHLALPDISPFEVWGAEVITASAPIELFQRNGEA